jgi:hypothetical protein
MRLGDFTYCVVSFEISPPPWMVRTVPPASDPLRGSIDEINPSDGVGAAINMIAPLTTIQHHHPHAALPPRNDGILAILWV